MYAGMFDMLIPKCLDSVPRARFALVLREFVYRKDDRDILDVVEVVIAVYEKHWFRTEDACVSLK